MDVCWLFRLGASLRFAKSVCVGWIFTKAKTRQPGQSATPPDVLNDFGNVGFSPIREAEAISGTHMQANNQPIEGIDLAMVRDIATRRLRSLSRTEDAIRECFLIKEEFFHGVRFELQPFQLTWKVNEGYASIQRNDLVIETIALVDDGSSQRRAA